MPRDDDLTTSVGHARPESYSGEPPDGVLSRIYQILTSPNGELSMIRRDVNGLFNLVQKRQRDDELNWNFFKSELSATRHDVKRIEEKLDRIDLRVDELERRVAAHAERIAALEEARAGTQT